jgi:transposase
MPMTTTEDTKLASNEADVFIRRQKVWALHKQGFFKYQIAERLGVSLKTVSRDFQTIKQEAVEWMNALPEGDVQLHHKHCIETVEEVLQELWRIYHKTKYDGMKLKILSIIAEKTKMHSEMMSTKNVLEIRPDMQHQLKLKERYGKYPSQRFLDDPIVKPDNSQEQNVR